MAERLKFYESKPNLKFLKKAADTLNREGSLFIQPIQSMHWDV